MGAAASAGGRDVFPPPERSFYCHSCFNYVQVHGDINVGYVCSSCESSFVEEAVTDRNGALENALDESLQLLNAANANVPLNAQQAMRLASTAAMLRIFESQLRHELEAMQPYLQRQREGANVAKPLTRIMKRKLRKVKVTKIHCEEQQFCPICSEENVFEAETLLLQCGHIFHEACVMPWLEMKRTCPLCRNEINDSPLSVQDLRKYSEKEIRSLIIDIADSKKSALAGDLLRDEMQSLYQKHTRIMGMADYDFMVDKVSSAEALADVRDDLVKLLHKELQIEYNSLPQDANGQVITPETAQLSLIDAPEFSTLGNMLHRRRSQRRQEEEEQHQQRQEEEEQAADPPPHSWFSPSLHSSGSLEDHLARAYSRDMEIAIGPPAQSHRGSTSEEASMFRQADTGAAVQSNSFAIGNTYVLRSSGTSGTNFTATTVPVHPRGNT